MLLIYNPNPFVIKVEASNYGLSNNVYSDSAAWKSYFDGTNTSITVAAGGYGNLFSRTILNNSAWGVISRLNIKNNNTSVAANATLFDLAYVNSSLSGNATAYATSVGTSLKRGKGEGFFTNLSCTIPMTSSTPTDGIRVNFGATNNSGYSGNECATITDASGSTSGKLPGAFGQQMSITVTISNQTGSAKKFRIYLGGNSGVHAQAFSFQGTNVSYNSDAASAKYYDIIESDSIANNGTQVINFFTALPGGKNTPLSFGVRAV